MMSKEPGFVTTNGYLVGRCSKCGNELRATLIDYFDVNPRRGTCTNKDCGNVEPAQWPPNLTED